MKKIIAFGMSLILIAGVFAGCKKQPNDKQTAKLLEEKYGGERFEVSGGNASSLDRDLEFEVWYDKDGMDIWPDVEIGGDYNLYSSYRSAVCSYWNDEYRKCIDKYDFAEVDYGMDGDDEDACAPNLVYIFIDNDASSEARDDVESLLKDLREICREEEDFHDSDHYEAHCYMVYIWYVDSIADEYLKSDGLRIEADTKDKELRLDNIDVDHKDNSDPRRNSLSNGNAMIYVK